MVPAAVPVLLVAALILIQKMQGWVGGTAVVNLTSGLQSVSVTAGQQVTFRLPAGATWKGGGIISANLYAAVAPTSGAGDATLNAPPSTASFVAEWVLNGQDQGAVVLLVPPGQTGNSPVTDATTVAYANTALMAIGAKGLVPGLTFGQSGSTQTFSQGLAAFQAWVNANALGGTGVQIRTDGVLDYATLSLLISAGAGLYA